MADRDQLAPTLRNIRAAIADHFELAEDDLTGPSRRDVFAVPRMIGYMLSRELTDASYQHIARTYGNRDHTTILSGIASAKIKVDQSFELRAAVKAIKAHAERLAIQERGGMFHSVRGGGQFSTSRNKEAA